MEPGTLIFDVDGTLADTERDGHRVAFNLAFAEAGLDWVWDVDTYGRLLEVTGGRERLHHYIRHWKPPLPPAVDPDTLVGDLHARKTRRYLELLRSGRIPLRRGVGRLLREARGAGLRLAIATTTTEENVRVLLETRLGREAPGWFDLIAAGDVVPHKKPAPDVYEHVCRTLGVDPASCLALEDSANGLAATLGAGIGTVITVNDYTRDQDFDGALLVVDSLGGPQRPVQVLRGGLDGFSWISVEALGWLARIARRGGGPP